jgi:hypothetical protein
VFGTGWRTRNVWVRLLEPGTANVVAEAAPWSPATAGAVSGEIIRVRGFTLGSPLSTTWTREAARFAEYGFIRARGDPHAAVPSGPARLTTRTLHTTSDTFDHLIPEDLRQAAVVTATMLYNTGMRDELLHRAPLAP